MIYIHRSAALRRPLASFAVRLCSCVPTWRTSVWSCGSLFIVTVDAKRPVLLSDARCIFVCGSASSSLFVYRSLRWPMAHVGAVLRGRASPRKRSVKAGRAADTHTCISTSSHRLSYHNQLRPLPPSKPLCSSAAAWILYIYIQ